ncbi:MAG TPA: hypothetical protein VEX61_13660, partial [Burkholderiales bacterium]|nr:hypothetical protein [Burkholderiales bacterium]
WIYRRMDHRFEPPVLQYELRVSFVDGRAIHTVLARQGRPRDSDATWTPAEGRWQRLDSRQAGWARNTVWYGPQVKRWVKSVYEDAQGKIGEELVFFVIE